MAEFYFGPDGLKPIEGEQELPTELIPQPVKWSPRVTIVTPPDRDVRVISIEVPGFILHQTGDEFTAAMWEAVTLIKDWAETRSW